MRIRSPSFLSVVALLTLLPPPLRLPADLHAAAPTSRSSPPQARPIRRETPRRPPALPFDFWNEQVIREDVAASTVFFGDSITELWQVEAYFVPSGGILLNRGIGGDITPHMAKRFDADVIQLQPRNVVILAGTNDVARLLDAKKSDEEMTAQVMTNMKQMVAAARKPASTSSSAPSCPPTPTPSRTRQGPRAAQDQAQLEAMCASRRLLLVDYWSQMWMRTTPCARTWPATASPHYAATRLWPGCSEGARAPGISL